MNCKVCNNTTTNTPGIPFFRFPREPETCQKWAELCHLKCLYMRKGVAQFNKSFRICSDHFDADEMMHDGRKVRLFPSAEPKYLLKKFRKVNPKKNKAVLKKFNAAKVRLPNHYCRLCAEVKKDVISIYGWRGKMTYDLERKLQYFPFTIERCDVLPLGVCQDCMVKVDQFVEFVDSVFEAEMKLKDLLNNTINNVTVQILDPIKEILANSLIVPIQETQQTNAGETQTPIGGEEQIQSVNETQTASTVEAQIQGVNNPQDTDLDEAQSTGVNEAHNTSVGSTQEINIDLTQLLNGIEAQPRGVGDAQNITCGVTFQTPSDIPVHNLNNYVHLNDVIPQELYESLMNIPIEQRSQTEQNCPQPDLMKLNDEDFITLYGVNDNDITLHKDSNLYCVYSDVPTYDQFAPSQLINQTVIITTNFDNTQKFTCDICVKDFPTPEMLSSHIKAHCVQSNNENFEKCSTLDLFKDFTEEISKKAKETNWGTDVSNTEPNDPGNAEAQSAELPVQENKSSLKGRKKVRKKKKPQCEFCERMFPTLEECQEHEKTHQGIQRYVCLKCNKTYRSKKGLHRHFPVHSGETYPCPKCKTIFRRRDSLLNHKRVHRRFTCRICSFVSRRKSEVLEHEKDHELPVDLSTEPNDAGQAEKEFSEPHLLDLISERDLTIPTTLDEFLINTDPNQPMTFITISNEFTPMDDIEQIVANRLVAMEI